MIHQPSRRDLIKYGIGLAAFRKMQAQMFPGPGVKGYAAAGITFIIAGTVVGDSQTVTLDTTGGNFIYFGGAYHAAVPIAISDNKGNSYTALTAVGGTASPDTRSYYAKNATCGTNHIFTITGLLPGACVMVFAGVSTSSPLISENHANDQSGTAIQVGSVTPVTNGSLVCSTINKDIGATVTSINSGFTLAANINGVGGVGYGCATAYFVQPTAGAINPTYTTSSAQYDGSNAVFL